MQEYDDIGRLIGFGLVPKMTPGRSQDYAQLVSRYRSNPDFARAVITTARGQGLVILECNAIQGLVLAGTDDSPYAFSMEDYGVGTADQRLLHGLIHLAIAATVFPTARDLEDEDAPLRSVTVQDVYENVTHLAQKLRDRAGEQTDPPAECPQLEPVWRLFLRTRATDTTTDSRANPHTTLAMVRRALRFLTLHGFADEVSQAELEETFRFRARYRIHVMNATGYIGDAQHFVTQLLQSPRVGA